MAERVMVMLTRGPEDGDRATVGLVMANAALSLDKTVVVLLSLEAVRLGEPRVIQEIEEPGFQPFHDLWETFLEGGGEIWGCTPCIKKRGLEGHLDTRIKLVGAVAAMEFVTDNGVSVSF
jgi:predicted peroxiredoxin